MPAPQNDRPYRRHVFSQADHHETFRDVLAMHLVQHGVPKKVIQAMMGHKDEKSTGWYPQSNHYQAALRAVLFVFHHACTAIFPSGCTLRLNSGG